MYFVRCRPLNCELLNGNAFHLTERDFNELFRDFVSYDSRSWKSCFVQDLRIVSCGENVRRGTKGLACSAVDLN